VWEPTPMVEGRFGGQEVAFRMNAYYYGFASTGIAVIDNILSAVACAGKAYHSTECWNDESAPWHERLRGNSPAEWIQNAANDAASIMRTATPTAAADSEDAARWRALVGSARIRILGSAGLHRDTDPNGQPFNGYAHIGLELWTQHGGGHSPSDAVDWLTRYVDAARNQESGK
jgi:hypothetical protein